MKKLGIYILLLAAMPMLMISCKKESKNAASNVQFKLTDAPANFDALNIDVTGIMVHTQTGGWVTLHSSLGVINILSYVNGNSTLIAEGSFEGTIDQVQLMLGSNNSVVVNGVSHALSNSSSLQTALNLNLNGQLQGGGTYTWTIDFDAAQSVVTSGTGTFQLSPVIRLIVDPASISANASGVTGGVSGSGAGGINIGGSGSGSGSVTGGGTVVVGGSTTGSITGSLSPAGIASVCVTGSNGQSICTITDLSGHFTVQAISSGTYSVTITPALSLLGGVHTISNVSVAAGQTTNVGAVVL